MELTKQVTKEKGISIKHRINEIVRDTINHERTSRIHKKSR